jgi:hypothetical protein
MCELSATVAPPRPAPTPPADPRHLRAYLDVAVVVVVLVVADLIAHFTSPVANVVTVPVVAVGLVLLVRARGLGWSELGLGREHWKTGMVYAVAAVALVLTAITIGALLPWTRPMFLNDRYATVSGALVASLVIIPLQTVIPEELAFRGVAAGGSLLFGLWHIASSFGLTSGNVGFSRVLGGGVAGALAGIGLAVAVTAAAGYVFTWLRRRSGSLIAPIALHWSLNGMGALAAALVWHLS